jgi:hypothetical protein
MNVPVGNSHGRADFRRSGARLPMLKRRAPAGAEFIPYVFSELPGHAVSVHTLLPHFDGKAAVSGQSAFSVFRRRFLFFF